MTTFQMYMFTRLDTLVRFFYVGCNVSFMFALVAVFIFILVKANGFCYDSTIELMKKLTVYTTLFFLFFLCGHIAIPTQKEVAAIIIVPKILSNQNIDYLKNIGVDGTDIFKLTTQYTKTVLEEKIKEVENDHIYEHSYTR